MATTIDGKTPRQPASLTAKMKAGVPKATAQAQIGMPKMGVAVKV